MRVIRSLFISPGKTVARQAVPSFTLAVGNPARPPLQHDQGRRVDLGTRTRGHGTGAEGP